MCRINQAVDWEHAKDELLITHDRLAKLKDQLGKNFHVKKAQILTKSDFGKVLFPHAKPFSDLNFRVP